jgi:hypothetical protein
MVARVEACSVSLEAAGAALMQRQPLQAVGRHLVSAGDELLVVSKLLGALSPSDQQQQQESKDAAQRCQYASEQMILAGTSLLPAEMSKSKTTDKSWLKGG